MYYFLLLLKPPVEDILANMRCRISINLLKTQYKVVDGFVVVW